MSGEVTSAAATLTVSTIAITTQPVSQTVYAGQDATFTVGAAAALAAVAAPLEATARY